jgi:hypothetical protein
MSYDLATTAFAVAAPRKWVDNLVSHHELRGITSRKRGVSREFSFEGVVLISLVRALCVDLGMPIRRAAEIAGAMAGSGKDHAAFRSLRLPYALVLSLDADALIRRVRERLLDAVESAPRPRRGRPPTVSSSS